MVITGLLSANYGEHHLRHELDLLPFDDWIQRDVLVAGEIELKLLHAVPPALFEVQSHLALSSLDPVPTPSTALALPFPRKFMLDRWLSFVHTGRHEQTKADQAYIVE